MVNYKLSEENYALTSAAKPGLVFASQRAIAKIRKGKIDYDALDEQLALFPNPTPDQMREILLAAGYVHYLAKSEDIVGNGIRQRPIRSAPSADIERVFDDAVKFNNNRRAGS